MLNIKKRNIQHSTFKVTAAKRGVVNIEQGISYFPERGRQAIMIGAGSPAPLIIDY
ncbi:MAG TPA: hypothetical protein VN763_09240 [Saprospiraceae bacterium]|nr:hypothetical protein [Saprospiraceae bacterium]